MKATSFLLTCHKVSSALILSLLLTIEIRVLLRTHQLLVNLGLSHPLALFHGEDFNTCHTPAPLSCTPYGTSNSFTGTLLTQMSRGEANGNLPWNMWGKSFAGRGSSYSKDPNPNIERCLMYSG